MPDWHGHWRVCARCGVSAEVGSRFGVKDTEFGPQPICGRCAVGDVGPWYGSVAWCEQQRGSAA